MPMTVVTAKVDSDVKERAERILRENGRTTSQVVRELMVYIDEKGELPMFLVECEQNALDAKRRRMLEVACHFEENVLPLGVDDARFDELLADARAERYV